MSTWNVCTSPGNMSRLKRKPGIQNEWMTSTDVRSNRTAAPAGRTSSGTSVLGADDLDAGVGVVELPLPLEADDLDDEVDVVVDVVDRPDARERDGEQGDDDQQRDDRVGDLDRDVLAHLPRQVGATGGGSARRRRRSAPTTSTPTTRAAIRKPFHTRSMSSACSVSGGGSPAITLTPPPDLGAIRIWARIVSESGTIAPRRPVGTIRAQLRVTRRPPRVGSWTSW